MRIVLDTNILISALISPAGPSDSLYRAWRNGQFYLITSEEHLEEFRRITRYPHLRPYIQPAAGTMLNEIRLLAVMVSNLPKLKASRDPGDNFILAMAVAGHADFLVTKDKRDILSMKRYQQTRIITVGRMAEILKE